MGRPEINKDGPQQKTCKVCGLTARNKDELEDHIHHAHRQEHPNNSNEKAVSAEQKIHPYFET
ncbi:MAG: hypothetical protein WKF36_09530 [Candidatus Nitrosocosmicus sp.]